MNRILTGRFVLDYYRGRSSVGRFARPQGVAKGANVPRVAKLVVGLLLPCRLLMGVGGRVSAGARMMLHVVAVRTVVSSVSWVKDIVLVSLTLSIRVL